MNMSVYSMKLCSLFNTFWVARLFVVFKRSNISSHCSIAYFDSSSFELLVFNFFKVSSTNMALG
jgi:hypothetical protein